ncbi:carbohydrate kinase family protein [Reinekea blandensis]|uniref:Sugar kinase, ribokinase family protein n=1 Tax=Reinekea blandensis MED297 TaxID=314283 RepID=A4BE77_9GAMM|nr:carbohydrate kinase family protein [Reinekea blandensis]EAR09555.1 Sugar kinase, ribokinase family protein [Reinekea blandensis MED297]
MTTTTAERVLVIGGANVDMSGTCLGRLIPGDSNPGIVSSGAGGVGRNIADNLARLGLSSTLLSVFGNDIGRTIIEKSCQSAGVDTSPSLIVDGAATGSYLAIHNQLGALLAAISDMAITESLTPERLKERLPLIQSFSTLVLDANLPQASLEWLVEHSQNQTLMVDAVSATKAVRLKRMLPKIDLLKVNRDEASAILGQPADDKTLSEALHKQGVKTILLSQGPQGASLYSQQAYHHKDAIKGDNASDTGAGDALFAGFIAARFRIKEPSRQLEFAIACATAALSSQSSVSAELSFSAIRQRFFNHWPDSAFID